jgi:hypothetical protein
VIVLVLLVRDEEDILESMLTYHLAAGIDHVVATDHRSRDGTSDILRSFERRGVLTYLRDDREVIEQAAATTAMAHRAARELGADWVVCADADEFWWSREGRLAAVLQALPERFAVVCGVWRHFVLRPDDGREAVERMTIRCRPDRDLSSVYQRQVKVAFRASRDVSVEDGSHGVAHGPPGQVLRGWYPFEVLHFPYRSSEQLGRKVGQPVNDRGLVWQGRHRQAALTHPGGLEGFRSAICPEGSSLRDGIAAGALTEDVRLRDALRAIRRGDDPFPVRPTPAEDADFALDVELVAEVDSAARLGERLDALEERLAATTRSRLSRRLRTRPGRTSRYRTSPVPRVDE